MLSLLRRTRICMSGNKIPFVLCGSRFAPAALHSQEISIDPAVKRELRETLLVPPKFSISPNAPAKKKPKRPALDALAHWCGAHQQEALQLQTSTSEIDEFVNETPLRDVDDAAFQWLHGAVHHLSGEQLLLVCSFVCEVLYCRLSTSVAGAGAKPDVFVRKHLGLLLNRIASLLGRIDADIRPEAQPLSALMSCLYSVQRLASCESPLLDEPEKALIRAPPSLFFAILHKLRGGELGKLFQHEADIAVDVCLSFLFVADEERRQAYFSRRHGTIVAIVLRRLIRYITPLLKDIKVAPAEVSESLVVGQDEGSDAAGGGHQLHGAGSPTMSECVTIMKNITFSPPSSRLKLLSYLLRVRRDPAHYSSDDLRLLVKVLDTISSIQSQDASGVRAEIIAPLNLPEGDPLLVAQLLSYSEVGMSRHTEYLNSASLSNVSSEDAKQVVRMAGAHLEFSALQRYIAVALAHPTLAAAFLPAATAVSVLPASSKGKIALCETMEQFLLILLQRLENVGDDTESESSDGELRDKMREYISLLCDLVDWTAVTLPATPTLALQRLCLFTRLAANGYHVHTPTNIVDLAMKSLQHEATKTMVDTLNAVSKALPLVTDLKERRTILEKMLDYNGSRSTSSAYRFLTLLAPMATVMNVCKSDLVRQITNLQTLNPHKLRQIGIESQQEGISTFSVILTNAIDFILASVEWRTDTAHQRDVITLWVTDYVFYAADLAKSRKQVTTTSALRANDEKEGQKEEEKESEEESVLPTPSVALDMAFEPGPSTEELERVFVSMLRSGVRLPDIFIPELSFRIQRLQKRGPLLTEGDAGTRFLPPAHFVFACKLGIALDMDISLKFVEYYIAACDCRTINDVIISLFTVARAMDQGEHDALLTNIRLASNSFEFFLRRIERMGENLNKSFHPTTASSVVANTLRFVVNYLTRSEKDQRALRHLNEIQRSGRRDEAMEDEEALVAERQRLEGPLTRIVAYLSAGHMKDIGLLILDNLAILAPSSAEYLVLRLSCQLNEFSQVDLLYLARKYPQAEELVIKELQKYDIAVTVDLNDFMRVMGNLPMSINVMIIKEHLPRLSFQWCTRLLSALSRWHDTIPSHLLALILRRLEEVTETASIMDRNMALVALQKYMQCDKPSSKGGDDSERQRLLKRCCEGLLVVDGIDSLKTLESFLADFPDALGASVSGPLIDHIVNKLLNNTAMTDLDGLIKLCQLLKKHRLLCGDIKLAIMEGFFMKTLQGVLLEHAGGGTTTSSSGGGGEDEGLVVSMGHMPAAASYPLNSVLSLALLLCEGGANARAVGGGAAGSPTEKDEETTDRVLRVVRKLYTSPQDQLIIASTLVDQRNPNPSVTTVGVVAKEICLELIKDCEKMTSNGFSRLLQCISRLKCWSQAGINGSAFAEVFRRSCKQADAHSRCVAFKAVSLEPDMFLSFGSFMIPLLQEATDVMSNEDIELVLSSVLGLPLTEALELLLDAIGTRLLRTLDHCKRSTLIRLLQCHAFFGVQDDMLINEVIGALTEQCGRDARLNTVQVLTLLQSVVDLDVFIPPRLVLSCFSWLEHHLESMTITQLGHAVRLAVDVEVGYTPSVHALAMRALEQRDAMRGNIPFREAVEAMCREFSVEIPWHLRAPVLRRQYQLERLIDYRDRRREMTQMTAKMRITS